MQLTNENYSCLHNFGGRQYATIFAKPESKGGLLFVATYSIYLCERPNDVTHRLDKTGFYFTD